MDEPQVNTYSQDSPQHRLGGSHHLPLIIFSPHGHGPYTQMSFCPGTLKLGILKLLK